jgi:hypothetical protein
VNRPGSRLQARPPHAERAGGPRRLVLAVAVGAAVLSACGGGPQAGSAAGALPCAGPQLALDQAALPDDFPIPPSAVLTGSAEAGPSRIVEGFHQGDVGGAHAEWMTVLQEVGYDILFEEVEESDAEISYRSPDQSSTGQVALRAECRAPDRIYLRITNRPG